MPPESYSGYFAEDNPVAKRVTVERMGLEANRTYWLDRKRFMSEDAMELWNDCMPIHSSIVRIIWCCFERDGINSSAGMDTLRACVRTLADNKGVEELHKYGKMAAKRKASQHNATAMHLQHVINRSQIIEHRGIPHNPAVTKEAFLKKWKTRKRFLDTAKVHRAASHKLPAHWSAIKGDKAWRTTSEVTGRCAASAWRWLQHMRDGDPYWLGRLSRWILPKFVFTYAGAFWASLNRGKWSVIAWPLLATEVGDGTHRFRFKVEDGVGWCWITVRDVGDVQVAPYREVLTRFGIELEQSGPLESLGKASLRVASLLSFKDLFDMVNFLNMFGLIAGQPNRKKLITVLCEYFVPGDRNFLEAALASKLNPDALDILVNDPLFDMTWDELDDDDKHELGDVKKAINRKRAYAPRGHRRPVGRAKAKARAKPKPAPRPPVVAPDPVPVDPAPEPVPPPVPAPPPILRGDYKYVPFHGGHIVFSGIAKKINGHCLNVDHNHGAELLTQKCHMDRSVPDVANFTVQRVKGRPIGVIGLFLIDPLGSGNKGDHNTNKAVYCTDAYFNERRDVRAEIWNMRHEHPDVVNLFGMESKVPEELLMGIEPELWEPRTPF